MPRDPAEVLREDRIRLIHMLEAERRIARYCAGMIRATLEGDEMRLLAVVKSIEVIGEASTKVSEATQARVRGIDWLGVRRMRNRMIRGYDTIDAAREWDAVELDDPGLITALESELGPGPATAGSTSAT
jgi:uncharacterized protein with HEPN domain